jgi:transcriptional regulator with XRE-family HTH domain
MTHVSDPPANPGVPQDFVRRGPKKRVAVRPAQCRAARAWIGWTQADLARRAGVARKTVADFERGNRSLHYGSQETIKAALESAGAEFLGADDVGDEGVRFREIRRDGR